MQIIKDTRPRDHVPFSIDMPNAYQFSEPEYMPGWDFDELAKAMKSKKRRAEIAK